MEIGRIRSRVKNFFREDAGEVVGAYFDGGKIFVVRLTAKFETVEVEVEADSSTAEQIATQIALVCKQKDWSTSAVGFCLRAEEVVTFQTEVGNVPEKELPALVKSWAEAQAGAEAVFASVKVGEELWMETLPRVRVEELCAAFKKAGLNLRAISVKPDETPTTHPFERTKFITEIVRDKKPPNLLSRSGVWSWRKISLATAIFFLIALLFGSAKIFLDYREAEAKLDAAKLAIENLRADINLKAAFDSDVAELHKLNAIAAQIDSTKIFNPLLNLGKIAGGGVRLTGVHVDDKSLELEGVANKPLAVRNYLTRVKNSVAKSARLERSEEQEDGIVTFAIRATIKK